MNDELAIQRLKRLSEEAEQLERELLQIAAQRKLFRQSEGREPETSAVLAVWASTHLDGPVDPYEVLTRQEIAQVWEDAEDPARQSF